MRASCKRTCELILVGAWAFMASMCYAHAAGKSPQVETPIIDFQDSPKGNQRRGLWVYGNDFSINPDQSVLITAVGAFDDGSSFGNNVLVGIYDQKSGQRIVGTIVSFKNNGLYQRFNRTRWQRITPIRLGPGKYSVIAANCGPSTDDGHENAYNSLTDGTTPTIRCNSMGGAFNADGGRWLAQKSVWKALPSAISSWSGVRETEVPPFAAASILAVNDDENNRRKRKPTADQFAMFGQREEASIGSRASQNGKQKNKNAHIASSMQNVHNVSESSSRALNAILLLFPLGVEFAARVRRRAKA